MPPYKNLFLYLIIIKERIKKPFKKKGIFIFYYFILKGEIYKNKIIKKVSKEGISSFI